MAGLIEDPGRLDREQRLLIGAYFTHEYSDRGRGALQPVHRAGPGPVRAAAGELRFIVSLRAIGEGHLSSIEFRSGVIDSEGNVHVDDAEPLHDHGPAS